MKNLFEYTDILRSPIEAFTCVTGSFPLPVEAHWHYFMEVIYMQEGSVLVTCNDACKRIEAGSVNRFTPFMRTAGKDTVTFVSSLISTGSI